MKKKSLLLVGLLSMVLFAGAQTDNNKVAIGLYFGKNEYNGDLGNGIFNFNKAFYGFGGVSFATYISPSFDLSLQGNYGNYGYFPTSNTLTNMLGAKYEGTLSLH